MLKLHEQRLTTLQAHQEVGVGKIVANRDLGSFGRATIRLVHVLRRVIVAPHHALAVNPHPHSQLRQIQYRLSPITAERGAHQADHAALRGLATGVANGEVALHTPGLHRACKPHQQGWHAAS